jgi:hypothetical protein
MSSAGAAPSLPLSTPLAPPPPKEHHDEGQRTRSVHCRRRLGRKQPSLRDAFRRLDLPLRRGRLLRRALLSPAFATRAPLSRPSRARLVRVMGPFPPLFRPCQQRIGSWPCRKRCLAPTSAADFCCHEHPRASSSQACGLRRIVRRDLPQCPRRRLRASGDPGPSTTTPDSRCRHLRP